MINGLIHSTAIVSEHAKLGDNVSVGPYAVISEPVELGDNCVIHAHAIVSPFVKMGGGNQIYPYAVIGTLPQDQSFDPKTITWVEIGNDNDFREGVTISRATQDDCMTSIGSNCFLMNNSHVAHDCSVGDGATLANGVALGGYVQVGDKAFIGGGSMVHQFARIGSLAMVTGMIGLRKDVIPFTMIGGEPIRHYRLNTVGLRRAGITGQRSGALSDAYRRLRDKQAIDNLPETEEINYLKDWLAAQSKRGVYGFVTPVNYQDRD